MKKLTVFASLLGLGFFSSSASLLNYTGMDLSGLAYTGNPASDATFVVGTPSYANLYTSSAFIGGDTPKVAVNGSFGTLSTFSASYVVLNQTGGGPGNSGYWDLIVSDPNNIANVLEIVAYSGTDLNSSTQVHTPGGLFAFGTLLSSVYGITDGSTTLGNWIVDSAGVEIGNYGNTEGPMDLQIASLSLNVPGRPDSRVPDATPTWLLFGLAMSSLFLFRLRPIRLALAK